MKIIALFLLSVSLLSCSRKDQQFCDCLAISEKMNRLSKELIVRGASQEKVNELIALKKTKVAECKNYQTMGGEEMLKKKQACH
jgi:hypothetical protein